MKGIIRFGEHRIPLNPKLPARFGDTPNDARPESHERWWDRPYIETEDGSDPDWLKAFPSGTRYMVRCLDGGAWDRSTLWGCFPTLDEAIECAVSGPCWRGAQKR